MTASSVRTSREVDGEGSSAELTTTPSRSTDEHRGNGSLHNQDGIAHGLSGSGGYLDMLYFNFIIWSVTQCTGGPATHFPRSGLCYTGGNTSSSQTLESKGDPSITASSVRTSEGVDREGSSAALTTTSFRSTDEPQQGNPSMTASSVRTSREVDREGSSAELTTTLSRSTDEHRGNGSLHNQDGITHGLSGSGNYLDMHYSNMIRSGTQCTGGFAAHFLRS